MFKNVKNQKFIQLFTSYIILIFAVVIIVYRLLWSVGASFNTCNSLISSSLISENTALDHYEELFAGKESLQYGQWYINSIKISVFTMIGSVICVSFTAYAFTRFRFTGRKNALVLFLLLEM